MTAAFLWWFRRMSSIPTVPAASRLSSPTGRPQRRPTLFSSRLAPMADPALPHQPPSGMSVSVQNINDRLNAPNGQHDPIFAPVDGSDCPDLVPAANTSGAPLGGKTGKGTDFNKSHSLILSRGVFRIFLPVPANADYTISAVSDPYGCNKPPNNTTSSGAQQISVYRRPLISGNLAFVTNTRDSTLAAAVPPSTVPTPNSATTDPVYGTPLCVEGGGNSIAWIR